MQTDTGRWIKWISDIPSVVFKPLPSNLSRCLLLVDMGGTDQVHLGPSKLNRQKNVHFFLHHPLLINTQQEFWCYLFTHLIVNVTLFVIHNLNISLVTFPEPVWSRNTLPKGFWLSQWSSPALTKWHLFLYSEHISTEPVEIIMTWPSLFCCKPLTSKVLFYFIQAYACCSVMMLSSTQ